MRMYEHKQFFFHNFSLNEYRDTFIANNFWIGMDEAF